MESKYSAILKTKEGGIITFGGNPVVDSKHPDLKVEGLTPGNEATPTANTFGESGDIFHHVLWRHIMAVLWTFGESRPSLLGLVSMFCMRGKNIRNLWKGTCQTFSIPLPDITDESRKKYRDIFGDGLTYALIINFPRESSKVPGAALTMERFKCIMRPYSAPEMITAKRLSAICAASGYEDMFRSFLIYEAEKMTTKIGEVFEPDTEESKFWSDLLSTVTDPEITSRMTGLAIASGSVSTKELYADDEIAIKGTIWWTGVNAMMTDAYNRIGAQVASIDRKARLENSAFYSDFKKKLSAKGITEASGTRYMKFLQLISSAIAKYIRRGTLMSQEENQILDAILASAARSATVPGAEAESSSKVVSVTGTTPATMRESIQKAVDGLQIVVPVARKTSGVIGATGKETA